MKSDRYYLLMKPSQNTWSGILVMDSSSAQPVCLFDDASINGKNNVVCYQFFKQLGQSTAGSLSLQMVHVGTIHPYRWLRLPIECLY
jgi:hypothetical protein